MSFTDWNPDNINTWHKYLIVQMWVIWPGSQTRPFAGLSMQAMQFCIGSKLRWNVRCVVNIVTDMIIKKRSGNKEGSTRGDNLFLPLQRTGTFASIYIHMGYSVTRNIILFCYPF